MGVSDPAKVRTFFRWLIPKLIRAATPTNLEQVTVVSGHFPR